MLSQCVNPVLRWQGLMYFRNYLKKLTGRVFKVAVIYFLFLFVDAIPFSLASDSIGFYPLWETTGNVLEHRRLYLGTNGAAFGIANTAQIGVQPVSFMYRAPNIQAKFLLFKRAPWSIATQLGATQMLEQASRAFLSPMYTSRLDNPDFSITLLPVSIGASYDVSDWLQIHQGLTGLTLLGHGVLKDEFTPGYSVVAELMALNHHSALIHVADVGLWKHDLTLLGISYRYQSSWFEFRLGYFYRFRSTGMQSSPLIGFGFSLS